MKRVNFFKRSGLFASALLFTLFVTAPSALAAITINEHGVTTSSSQPHDVTLGPDGNMWFTEFNAHKIGTMSPDGTMLSECQLAANAHPNDITAGPDGRLWFTEYASPGGTAAIGALATTGSCPSALSEYALSPSTVRPHAITVGPDNNLWFTEIGGEAIGRIQTDGTVLPKFPLAPGSNPYGIAVGPDNNIWFTEWTANNIVKMNLSGTILGTYPITGGYGEPYAITNGPDGNLWFTLQVGHAVAKITTSGAITYFPTPSTNSNPHGIVTGPDGNIWFAETSAHKIAMITPAGTITEYPTPTSPSGPFNIDVGPNNTLWFGESTANQIGVVSGLTIPVAPSSSPQAPSTGFGVYQYDPLQTLLVFGLVTSLLFGLALAIRKVAKSYR